MKYFLLALLFLLPSCVPERPFQNAKYHGDIPVSWDSSSFPIEVAADMNMTGDELWALSEAADMWNRATGEAVFSHMRILDLWNSEDLLTPRSGTVYAYKADIPDRDGMHIQGIARAVRVQNTITHAYVVLDVAVSADEIEVVFIHELGHALGLSHTDDVRSIMYISAVGSDQHIMPSDIDYVRWQVRPH